MKAEMKRKKALLKLVDAAKGHLLPAPDLLELIARWKAQKKTLRVIAIKLNRLGIRTSRGKEWSLRTVKDLTRRYRHLLKA